MQTYFKKKYIWILALAWIFSFTGPGTIQAASSIVITIPGEPRSTFTWTLEDSPIPPIKLEAKKSGRVLTSVTWSSSNTSVAEVNPTTGDLTIKTVTTKSTAVITASVETGEVGFREITVNPKPIPLEKFTLTLSPTNIPIVQGMTQPVKVEPNFEPSNTTDRELNWKSTNPSVVDVDQDGNLTIGTSGTATIIATTKDGKKTAFYEIPVFDVPVTGIRLNKEELIMLQGRQEKLQATITPSHAGTQIQWSSSSRSIADVDQDGLIKANRAGKATITAKTSNGNKIASAVITVAANTPQAKSVTVKRKTSTSVELSWSGTRGDTLVEILEGSHLEDSQWVSTNKAAFSGLDIDTEYVVKINDVEATKFTIKNLPGSITVSNFKVEHISATDVDFTWGGTPDRVLVEIKKVGSDRNEDELTTSIRSATFVGLKPDTAYQVYFDGIQVGTFKTEKSVKEFKIISKTDTTVQLSWNGTIDRVHVELKKINEENAVEDEYTRNKQTEFDDLRPDTSYKVYIDDVYVGSFKTDPGPLIKNFKITRKSSSSVEMSWTEGPSDEVEVVIKKSGSDSITDEEETSRKKVTFTGLSSTTEYKVYMDDIYIETFRIDKLQTIRSFTAMKNNQDLSVKLMWASTEGTVDVTLKNGSTVFASNKTSNEQITFTGLIPDQEYGVYINDQFIQTIKLGFPDIASHWAKTAINRLFQQKIVNGYEDGRFMPEATVNREEFVTMLIRAKGYPLIRGQQTFTDVPSRYWANSYIQTAVNKGIIIPAEYGSQFQPLTPITREEMAVMLARALGLKANPDVTAFTDQTQIKNIALVGAITKAGIIKGYPDKTFRPKNHLTRAEAADVINQIYKP